MEGAGKTQPNRSNEDDLIVDDEPAARYGLRRALESKYRIVEADSAEAAREALPRETARFAAAGCRSARSKRNRVFAMGARTGQRNSGPYGLVAGHSETAVEALQIGAAIIW